jgi:cyclopropane fatty-acyl-phospholipid synthase-like methyltransferase
MKYNKLIDQTRSYFNGKLKEHGFTVKGLDWNSEEGAIIRYKQLLSIINISGPFSILDYGCGFGMMYKYMKQNFKDFEFTGFDISSEMTEGAKKIYPDKHTSWFSDENALKMYDFVVASGIFNVKQGSANEEWTEYVLDTLNAMNRVSSKGFSFNILTKYSDKEFMKDNLYYADPAFFFDYCKKNFSKHVALLHDYPLYEFSILVRKNI